MNRPTRSTLFGCVLCLIWAGFYTPRAKAFDAITNADIECAVVSGGEMAFSPEDSHAHENAMEIYLFFLGRLTGRDDQTYWKAILLGRMAELKDKARQPRAYQACANFAASKMR